jgi:hypothetical protein
MKNNTFSVSSASEMLKSRPTLASPYVWISGNGVVIGRKETPAVNYGHVVVFSYGETAGSVPGSNGSCQWFPQMAARTCNPMGSVLNFPINAHELLMDATGEVAIRSPVQKPVNLIREIVRVHSSPGDIILEVCSGSSPCATAGMLEGRHVLSLDSDEACVQAASERLRLAKIQFVSSLPGKSQLVPGSAKKSLKRKHSSRARAAPAAQAAPEAQVAPEAPAAREAPVVPAPVPRACDF